MEKQKYTPGPWHVRYCDDTHFMNMTVISTDRYPSHTQFGNEDDTVCIVFHQLEPRVGTDSDDCGDANAQLISKAPEMLSMLQSIVDSINEETYPLGRIAASKIKRAKELIQEATT